MGEKTSGNPFPTLIWAGAQRGGRSTAACGNGQRWLRRRHCMVVPHLYSRGKAVEGGGIGRGQLAAINGARGIAERRDA